MLYNAIYVNQKVCIHMQTKDTHETHSNGFLLGWREERRLSFWNQGGKTKGICQGKQEAETAFPREIRMKPVWPKVGSSVIGIFKKSGHQN